MPRHRLFKVALIKLQIMILIKACFEILVLMEYLNRGMACHESSIT